MVETRKEIEKFLRKEKPLARLVHIKKDGIFYKARHGAEENGIPVFFKVPLNDIGDAKFEAIMPSQLLIRYLID